jgi:hypothetical protein
MEYNGINLNLRYSSSFQYFDYRIVNVQGLKEVFSDIQSEIKICNFATL